MRFSSNQKCDDWNMISFYAFEENNEELYGPMNNIRMSIIMCIGFVLLASLLHSILIIIIIILIHWNVQISIIFVSFSSSFFDINIFSYICSFLSILHPITYNNDILFPSCWKALTCIFRCEAFKSVGWDNRTLLIIYMSLS